MGWVTGEPIKIVVPGIPKGLARNRHRIVRKKDGTQFVANYLPSDSAHSQSTIRAFASQAMAGRPPLDGPIDLRVVAFMPIPASWSKKMQAAACADKVRPTGRPDADNVLKGVCDAIQEICVRNDTLFTETSIWKRFGIQPRLVIECRLLTWID